jgi:hypothetical protein
MAPTETGFSLMLVGASLLPDGPSRVTGALAAAAVGLAIAGLRAAPAGAAPDPGFVAVDVALLVLGVLLAVTAAGIAWRVPSRAARAGAAALMLGAVALAWGGAGLAARAAPGPTVLAILAVSASGVTLLLAGRLMGRRAKHPDTVSPRPVAGVAGLAAGALAAAASPHLSLVILGVILAGWCGWLLRRAGGGSSAPVAPALTLVLLPAWWLMATIAGPEGLGIASLGALPFSPAAERLLAPALLVAAWAVSGLWPVHRQMPAALTAPVGALLLARVGMPAVPDGLEHWRPLAMPVVVVGIWHAALTGRLALLPVGLAWVGLLAPGGAGLTGAALLLAAALLLELAGPLVRAEPRRAVAFRVVFSLAAGHGALLVVAAGLRGEVVYTVLAVGGIVAAAGRALGAQARIASEPSAIAPSA